MAKVRILDVKNRRVIDPTLELARKDAVILELQEAAEFEAKVAEKLAINDTSYLPCHQKGHENQCPYNNYCPTDKKKTTWCKMKHARLAVEEELDDMDK